MNSLKFILICRTIEVRRKQEYFLIRAPTPIFSINSNIPLTTGEAASFFVVAVLKSSLRLV